MGSAALTLDQDIWRPKYNPWLIAVVVALAAFMEVLDTSIANVALPYMAGNLGASNDQSTWVLTSYLVSNAIILPISGWIKPFSQTPFRRNSEAWRLRSTASRPSWHPRSDQPWADGSPLTTPGDGFFSSISRSAWPHGFWCGAL